MAINLEIPRKLQAVIVATHQGAAELMRPIGRKYDLNEHAYPVELDTLVSLLEGASGSVKLSGADMLNTDDDGGATNRNGGNMAALLQALEASWGDVAMMLSVPYQGLGNAAIAAVATAEQKERLGKVWAAMAITEPGFGSDSAAVSTTAVRPGRGRKPTSCSALTTVHTYKPHRSQRRIASKQPRISHTARQRCNGRP